MSRTNKSSEMDHAFVSREYERMYSCEFEGDLHGAAASAFRVLYQLRYSPSDQMLINAHRTFNRVMRRWKEDTWYFRFLDPQYPFVLLRQLEVNKIRNVYGDAAKGLELEDMF